MKNKKRNSGFQRILAKNILKNSISASAWILNNLFQLGEMTIETFLSPSLYADFPTTFFLMPENIAKKKVKFEEMTIRQSIHRLQKYGFVEKKEGRYFLTKKGNNLKEYIKARKDTMGRKWDGKFRVVIFDIPEEKRKIRDWLRQELYLLEYRKLQESVFIGKYPLTKDLIEEIKRKKIGNYVNYLLADKVYKNII